MLREKGTGREKGIRGRGGKGPEDNGIASEEEDGELEFVL